MEQKLLSVVRATAAIHRASRVEDALQLATHEARNIIGAHQAALSLNAVDGGVKIQTVSLSEKYAAWRGYDEKPTGGGIYELVSQNGRAMRLTQAELVTHPAWRGFGGLNGHPPMRGWLAAPLCERTGVPLGVIQLSDKFEGDFTIADEAVLSELAAAAASAIEMLQLTADKHASDRLFGSIFANAALGIAIARRDGTLIRANDPFMRLLGGDATPGLDLRAATHPDDLGQVDAAYDGLWSRVTNEASVECRVVRPGQDPVWVRLTASRLDQAAGEPRTVTFAEDITEARSARLELGRANRRTTDILESISDAFFALDRHWRFTYLNEAAANLLRQSVDALLGQNIWDAFPDVVATDVFAEYQRAMSTGTAGSLRNYYEPFDTWFEIRTYPQSDGLSVYFRDITARVRTEERLVRAQRLEAVGQLTGGVAHDFNNLLTIILGAVDDMGDTIPAESPLGSLVQVTRTAAEQGAALTNQLLSFSRRQALTPAPVDLNGLVSGMEPLIRRTLGEEIEIAVDPANELWPVMIDGAQLEAALLNLCLNARDAMPDGGRIHIQTSNKPATAGEPDFVIVTVSDTGGGMSPEVQSRAFEPFFTTKPVGSGSGLGLSMVYGFANQSRGRVWIKSELGRGSSVYLDLPRAPHPPAKASQHPAPALGEGERILVVEDDPLVRSNVLRQLQRLGYAATSAADGPAAMAMLRGDEAYDLLFTDIVMPGGLNGWAVAAAARRLRPGLKVLFTSGYPDNAGAGDAPGSYLLRKPYRRAALAQAVRCALHNDLVQMSDSSTGGSHGGN